VALIVLHYFHSQEKVFNSILTPRACFGLWRPLRFGSASSSRQTDTDLEDAAMVRRIVECDVSRRPRAGLDSVGFASLSAALGVKSRAAGLANVIRASERHAVLLISGVPLLPNSGDAAAVGAGFSGVYKARAESGAWKLHSRIPLENLGRRLAHDIVVSVLPASGVTVEDRMRIQVNGRDGFALRLNHAAKIEIIRVASREPAHLFGGGPLWVELPEGETELTIRYSIEVEKGPQDTNSGCFLENAGPYTRSVFLTI
jgi:hypothetical protein